MLIALKYLLFFPQSQSFFFALSIYLSAGVRTYSYLPSSCFLLSSTHLIYTNPNRQKHSFNLMLLSTTQQAQCEFLLIYA